MTTLPQTTPMRLPRPSGAGQIAIPSANGALSGVAAHGPHAAGGGVQMTGADVWRVFRSNWWLIAAMVLVAAVAGYFVNLQLAKHYPRYTAAGLVRVDLREEKFRSNGEEVAASPQAIEVEQKTQAQAMLQPSLILNVLTDSDKVRESAWFKKFNNNAEAAKEALLGNLSVRPMTGTRFIQVEMTDRQPRDARTIVEELVDRYIADQKKIAVTDWRQTAANLEQQFSQYQNEYNKLSAELTNNSKRASSADSFKLFGRLESTRYELNRVADSRTIAERERIAAQTAKAAMDKMIESGETPPEVEAELYKDGVAAQIQAKVDDLDARIQQGGPQAQGLMRSRQQMQQRLDDRRETLRSTLLAAKKFEVESKYQMASDAFETADKRLTAANEELVSQQAEAARFKQMEEQQQTKKKQMDEVQVELEKIKNRKLPSSWSPIDWAARPPTPETPSFPKLPITMSVAVLLGLALSIGIAFLREVTDTSVRSPRDIARVGNLNLLGMIPHESDDPQAAGARLPLVIFDAPHSMAAEEFRKLRTRLQHTASLDSTRSILVSSANPGDGKTSVACNLAAGLALNGRRILLVDANFRRPDIHNVFEVANEQGFSDVLNDLAAFDTVVRDTPVQNLYVMPTGPKPVNATELLESQLLIDFIDRALEDYDHVIFDSGPLLIVSETMALAPRVDGVMTVVRARANSRGVLARMRDVLRQVKAENLGVVLNAVRSQGGGYYGRNIKTYYAYQQQNGNGA